MQQEWQELIIERRKEVRDAEKSERDGKKEDDTVR